MTSSTDPPQYRRIDAVIESLRPTLAAHLGDEKALWEHLPVAFEETFGRPLDRDDAHDIMLSQQIVRTLVCE